MNSAGEAIAIESAPAKINLFLHVGERRGDGFHPLQSLAVFAALGDRLVAEPADRLSLSIDGPFAAGLSGENGNLVLRAAQALAAKAGSKAGAKLSLTKNLPVASGIGGGSADAAAALRALSSLWGLSLDEAALCEIAAGLGSDVPVCIASEARWMEGRGEILTPVAALPHLPLLLVNPGVAVSTGEVFAALQTRSGVSREKPPGNFRDMADVLRVIDASRNDLEEPARRIQPVITEVLTALSALPGALFARMSGSGATCFALFPDDESCRRAAASLSQARTGWWIAPTSVPEFGLEHEDTGQDIGPSDQGL
ncbi:MAG TPA: 4-(cytidine 5'-diphospho)-2-C-methyl-D-erythritol kinase [Rhizomicrobium sp.]|nr:4-(cytidine 5'-diphospho)-2-C-methyl-D-erythritol kinase [Rhizomicrobium sp.]